MSKYYKQIKEKEDKYIQELFEFLCHSSIAATGKGMKEMAGKVQQKLKDLGAKTQLLKADGSYPYVYGELGEGEKTLLIYDHYDVQPCENIDLWESKPFEPEIRDGKIYARGVSDNKGNLMLRIQAIRLIQEKLDKLPIKIKFLIEGEEEIGSPGLHKLSDEYGHLWEDADICLWETGGVNEKKQPVMVLGQKGVTYMELSCEQGERDLHSGNASLVNSAVWRLIHALATLRDKVGNVTIPELNKCIRKPTETEKEMIKKQDWDAAEVLKSLGREEFIGGYNVDDKQEGVLTKHYFTPTCNICGIWGGFTEPRGIKTVLPNKATAKIDFRLVKDQDSTVVADIVRRYLDEKGFDDVEVNELINEPVHKSDVNNQLLQKVIGIISDSYGENTQLAITSGGSGPGYYVADRFAIPVFHLGAGYPGTNAHAPNENVRIDDYIKAIDATIDVILNL
jgi:acetylornithine deacetylase/succinyl-diaminopimelate desuccinylase-like protein